MRTVDCVVACGALALVPTAVLLSKDDAAYATIDEWVVVVGTRAASRVDC